MKKQVHLTKPHLRTSARAATALVLVAASTLLGIGIVSATSSGVASAAPNRSVTTTAHSSAKDATTYPIGTPDSSAPSGEDLPAAGALPGYQESYESDFAGSSLPSGWSTFSGAPSGDPGAEFASSHVAVGGGLLQLNASQNSGGGWATGGVCQCGKPRTYGAYFVRSRMTGSGPTQVELLWPTSGWPPEIDFDETFGNVNSSLATLHYSSSNQQVHQSINIDMTQWHTWGVIWSPTSVTYVVDGQVWGQVTDPSEIPNQPMTLDIQQQTWCASDYACPSGDASTDVDWVAEYTYTGETTTTTTTVPPTTTTSTSTTTTVPATSKEVVVGPFSSNSTVLSSSLKTQILSLAATIQTTKQLIVKLVGYGDGSTKTSEISAARANAVARFLRKRLATLKIRARITAVGDAKKLSKSTRQRVVASLS